MLNENGIVIDDGVFACLSPEHYLVSTTSGNAERIAGWLDEWHQCEWPDLDLVLMPVTTQWAVLTLAGASARALLEQFPSDIDFSAAAFPHMNFREGLIGGRCARVQRVSFTGELSYEISVAANEAEEFWQELIQRGAQFGITPIGLEAWLILRLEKGFLHVGSDTDGTTNPLDLGFGAMIQKKVGDFVGRRSLMRAHDQAASRRQFVGLEALPTGSSLVAGAHIITSPTPMKRSEGFVTSAGFSPTLGRFIGLGLLERGHARIDEMVTVFDEGRTVQARVVKPAFFDPSGERMNG
jgi:sarcosine oxidase subunit alpha